MANSTVAVRYAQALFAAASDNQQTEEVAKQLDVLAEALQASPDFQHIFHHLQLTPAEKQKMLAPILEQLLGGELIGNFVALLFRKRREGEFYNIREAYQTTLRQAKGEVIALVTATRDLGQQERAQLVNAVKQLTGSRSVDIDVQVDKSILGGLVIRVGDRVYDGSLVRRLQALKQQLMQAQVKQVGVSS